jgi:hypothetical protein
MIMAPTTSSATSDLTMLAVPGSLSHQLPQLVPGRARGERKKKRVYAAMAVRMET